MYRSATTTRKTMWVPPSLKPRPRPSQRPHIVPPCLCCPKQTLAISNEPSKSLIQHEDGREYEEVIDESDCPCVHGGEAPVQQSGKRGSNLLLQQPPQKTRKCGGGNTVLEGACAIDVPTGLEYQMEDSKINVLALRYSQKSVKKYFQCGRSVMGLVHDLLDQKVSLDDRFLRLTVFQSEDSETHQPILRCIDNRRLLALKHYARLLHPEPVLVNVSFFTQNELREAMRCVNNSDRTNGKNVRIRKSPIPGRRSSNNWSRPRRRQ